MSKIASLVVKFGALLFALSLDKQNAINFQLLVGVWSALVLNIIVSVLVTRGAAPTERCSVRPVLHVSGFDHYL